MPEDITNGLAGAVVAALATLGAIFRAQIRAIVSAGYIAIATKQPAPPLLDYKRQIETERQNRREDIDRLTELVDDIAERVRALEQTATAWKLESIVNTGELSRLQNDVQRVASRIGQDMDGLRDLLLEVLKRTR